MKSIVLLLFAFTYLTTIVHGNPASFSAIDKKSTVGAMSAEQWLASDGFIDEIDQFVGEWNKSRNYDWYFQKTVKEKADLEFIRTYLKSSHLLERHPLKLEYDRKYHSFWIYFDKNKYRFALLDLKPITLYINAHLVHFNPNIPLAKNIKAIEKVFGVRNSASNFRWNYLEPIIFNFAWAQTATQSSSTSSMDMTPYGIPANFWELNQNQQLGWITYAVNAGKMDMATASYLKNQVKSQEQGPNFGNLMYPLIAVGLVLGVAWAGDHFGLWKKLGGWVNDKTSETSPDGEMDDCAKPLALFKSRSQLVLHCGSGSNSKKFDRCDFKMKVGESDSEFQIIRSADSENLALKFKDCQYSLEKNEFKRDRRCTIRSTPDPIPTSSVPCFLAISKLDEICEKHPSCVSKINAVYGSPRVQPAAAAGGAGQITEGENANK